jgi:glycine/D-amino acid oxidase-like deaminating enzyme
MHPHTSQSLTNTSAPGGGIIGCTTAYFLTRHPAFNPALHTVTVLEASAIAAGASGKAGGLLALWAYPECLVPLSYRLHAELAREHNGAERWGYRRLGCGSITAVVTAKDLEKPRPGAIIPGVVANGSVNGNGDYKDSAPQEPQPTINGNGNDTSAPQPGEPQPAQPAQPSGALPIQSVNPDRQRDFAPFADEKQETPPQQEKEWEKLPKQSASATALLSDSPLPPDLDWINRSLVTDYSEMGLGRGPSSTETAQVHPYHFTTSMAQLARERGVNFVIGAKVIKINHSKTSVGSVEYEDRSTGGHRILSGATDVVVTAGPWTGRLLPKTKIEGLRAHSVVLAADVSPYAVFTDIALPADWAPEHRAAKGQRRKHRGNVDPEIYARPGGEVYACGMFLPF